MPPKKKSKQPQRQPETADEYLAEAVTQEESAEKWRAGDAQKAARFYSRALNIYEEALNLFPSSFDLSYNKARIQYEITQRPAIRAEFSSSVVELLQTALASHRVALTLEPEKDADALFNTAQVLTSLAEAIDQDTTAYTLLQEAVLLFQRCLERQQLLLQESEAQAQEASQMLQEQDNADGGVPLDDSQQEAATPPESRSSSPSNQWATIVTPVTYTSLLETCIAILATLSSLCGIITQPSDLTTLQNISSQLLSQTLPLYLAKAQDQHETLDELACETARYHSATADASYRLKQTTFQSYDQRLKQTFEQPDLIPFRSETPSPPFLTCYSDALVTFANSTANVRDKAVVRYTRLSKALDCLSEASKLPAAKNLSSIHIGRGDVELLRFQLANGGDLPDNLSNDKVRMTLLTNAATFYRGAASVARSGFGDGGGMTNEAVVVAATKEAVVKSIITGNNADLLQLKAMGVSEKDMHKVISDMVDESLISTLELQRAQIF